MMFYLGEIISLKELQYKRYERNILCQEL